MMLENLLVEADLKIQLNDQHQVRVKSVPNDQQIVLELKIPNVMTGVELLRQARAYSELRQESIDQQFSSANQILAHFNTRLDVVFLNQKLMSVGKGAGRNTIQSLLSAFPLDR
jgi:hypothetical protein